MFKTAKCNDRVWHIRLGYGIICSIDEDMTEESPICVEFSKGLFKRFTTNGKEKRTDECPTLFWKRIALEMPTRPFDLESEYRELKRKKFEANQENHYLKYNYEIKRWHPCIAVEYECLGTVYFSSAGIIRFAFMLNENKVTPEQLMEVAKKVGLEKKQ